MAFGVVTVTAAPTKIITANPRRQSYMFANSDLANSIYIGPDDSVLDSTGFPIGPLNQFAEDKSQAGFYLGDVYAICPAGQTAEIRYWERIGNI